MLAMPCEQRNRKAKSGASLFSVGKREDSEKIWNSGTQEKKPMRKFAAESNLMLSNVESMEVEQSVKNAE